MLVPLTAACVAAAAASFKIAAPALWTILATEDGRVGACTAQPNGMHDCGPAQVNAEIWVPQFARLLHRPEDQIFYALRDNGCFNINAAAYILRLKVAEARGNFWDGIGRYNSATPSLKHAYQQRLIASYQRLYGPSR
ncbi:MAG TPA: lytic transglycosylase domain-containing protein [Stellaceae bacterium]|nr:lytic transglycosylase domain-containing protein [Stellaceae bacterium]